MNVEQQDAIKTVESMHIQTIVCIAMASITSLLYEFDYLKLYLSGSCFLQQVLSVVYGTGSPLKPGLFFPDVSCRCHQAYH